MDETNLARLTEELRPQDIDLAFRGSQAVRRKLATELWTIVEGAVKRTLRPIARALRRDIGQEVEDFVQETWLLLLKDDGRILRMWDPGRGRTLSSWVHLVAHRHILRKLRGRRSNPWGDPGLVDLIDDGLPPQAGLAPDLDRTLYLLTLLDALRKVIGEARWALFREIFIDQRAPAEIAADAQLDVSKIYDISSYFRRQVRSIAMTLDRPQSPMGAPPDAPKDLCTDP